MKYRKKSRFVGKDDESVLLASLMDLCTAGEFLYCLKVVCGLVYGTVF